MDEIDANEILALLAKAHEAHPELRIGQLVSNAVSAARLKMDVFYASDADLAAGLRAMADAR